jgi:peptide/nickel transport system substrate-binding protein
VTRLPGTRGSGRPAAGLARRLAAAAAAVAVAAAAGCAAASSPSSAGGAGGGRGGTLTVGWTSYPVSMNPDESSEGQPNIYYAVAYDDLLTWNPDGTVSPGLAVKWGYVGTGQKVFRLTLRPHVKFADGQPVTAAAVAASVNYMKKGTGASGATLATVTAAATGPLQVTLTSTTPVPDMATLMTSFYGGTGIIAPKGLADPGALATQTYGAGEYVLDPAQTVADEYYTYTANPNYWNPSAIHYKKLVIRVILSKTSAVAALRTGQIDAYFSGDKLSAAAAKAAGMQVLAGPGYPDGVWDGLELMDRDGAVVKALGDVRVRQALNYAIDRPAVVDAVYGSQYASPEVQPALPSFDGYDPQLEKAYPYNLAKARKLLAAAGYAKGFTIPVTMQIVEEPLMEAIAGQLAKINVTLQFHPVTNIAGQIAEMFSGKIAAYDLQVSQPNMYRLITGLYLPNSPRNGLHQTSPRVQNLYNQASRATGTAATTLWRQLLTYMVNDAYTVPVVAEQNFYFLNTTTQSTRPNKVTDYLTPLQLSPKN